MHYLLACAGCRRQFDVAGRSVGERFLCSCGMELEVRPPRSHEAAVIRCSSCGAPRGEAAERCRYCSAEFTLHERDLDTVCSSCAARVSGRARFCHSCGSPILVRQAAVGVTDFPCPACGEGRALVSRQLGQTNVAMFECGGCGGMWIEREIFEVLAERARTSALPDLDLRPAGGAQPSGSPARGPFYRPCPVCRTRMNRRNYALRSGVVVDVCQRHGVWFDIHELEELLRWLRRGGDPLAEKRRGLEGEGATLLPAARTGPWEGLSRLPFPSPAPAAVLGNLAVGFVAGVLSNLFDS